MHKKQIKVAFFGFLWMTMVMLANNALAASIPFSAIGPREYTLPLGFKPYPEFVQSVEVNNNRVQFGPGGNNQDGTSSHTARGSTKLAYLFQIQGLSAIGFEAEAIVPTTRITGGPGAVTGIGDPVVGLAVWAKPSASTVLGVQDYLILPLGSTELSSAHTSNIFSLFGDHLIGRWDFDGDIGLITPLSYTLNRPGYRGGSLV